MDYLFDKIDKLKKDIKNKFLFFFLDYDGTISLIARTPDEAVITNETKNLLNGLAVHPMREVAIISGRSLKDIKNKVGLKQIIYAGNHGLEMEWLKARPQYFLVSGYRSVIRDIDNGLKRELRGFKGVLIENKSICLSLHYRMAKKKDISPIKAIFKEIVSPYVISGEVKISYGKKLLEVRPAVNWNKGSVVTRLLDRQKAFLGSNRVIPIYIGDDLTDEDAFKALRKGGITVFVGKPGSSGAKYYVKNTGEVIRFLKLIAAHCDSDF